MNERSFKKILRIAVERMTNTYKDTNNGTSTTPINIYIFKQQYETHAIAESDFHAPRLTLLNSFHFITF